MTAERFAAGALLSVLVLIPSRCPGEILMPKNDEARPEPLLFLPAAAKAMKAYKATHGEYAEQWYLLDITFANGPYRVSDPDVRPAREDHNRWKPRGCENEYIIRSADRNGFLIQAVDPNGRVLYEIREGMQEPRKVFVPAGGELCELERPRGKNLPEPVWFLNAAAAQFAAYRGRFQHFPSAWDQLPDFHYALTPHRATDPEVRPPRGTGRSWRPPGANFTYEITRADADGFEIRSRNEQGQGDYRIASGDLSPVPAGP
jgi:hypothetical protein